MINNIDFTLSFRPFLVPICAKCPILCVTVTAFVASGICFACKLSPIPKLTTSQLLQMVCYLRLWCISGKSPCAGRISPHRHRNTYERSSRLRGDRRTYDGLWTSSPDGQLLNVEEGNFDLLLEYYKRIEMLKRCRYSPGLSFSDVDMQDLSKKREKLTFLIKQGTNETNYLFFRSF